MREDLKKAYWDKYYKAKEKGVPFFPDIVFKDAVVALLVFIALIALAYFRGAPLEEPANPADTNYTPHPEWYFLWVYQLLKYFPGNLEIIGIIILPTIGILLVLLLPFFDRSRTRHFLSRPILSAITLVAVLGIAGLTLQAVREAPPPTATAATEGDPTAALYTDNCAPCHGPSVDVSPGTDLHAVIAEGEAHEGMPAWGGTLSTNEIDALVGFILSPSGNSVYQANCAPCHEGIVTAAGEPIELKKVIEQGPDYPPHADVDVPQWTEVLSQQERTALLNFLAAPDGERLFEINCAQCHGDSVPFSGTEEELRQIIATGGKHLEMPPWRERLSEDALDTLARYVVDPSAVPEGEALFEENCSSCHPTVPSAPTVDAAREIIATGGAHETMPVWGDVLTAEQLNALVQFTLELTRGEPIERGRELFTQYCAACHGNFGEGGPNPARPGYVIPPISTAEYMRTRDNATLRAIISQGQPNFGMSPFSTDFGGPLDDDQIDAIVSYLRQWETNPAVEQPPEVAAGVSALGGEQIYNEICAQCHGSKGQGGFGPTLRDPGFQTRFTDQELFDSISQGHEATAMIGFGGILTSSQINQVIDYIRQWRPEVKPTAAPAGEATAAPPEGEATAAPEEEAPPPAETPSFASDVVPILEQHCAMCHAGGTTLGGWDASSYDTVINSGDHGPVVVPGDTDRSVLAQKLLGTQQIGTIMPPSGNMPDEQIGIIIDWIRAGAPDN
jgi:mono/diheme cytochrome c family protein